MNSAPLGALLEANRAMRVNSYFAEIALTSLTESVGRDLEPPMKDSPANPSSVASSNAGCFKRSVFENIQHYFSRDYLLN